jgi:hypothetical protein
LALKPFHSRPERPGNERFAAIWLARDPRYPGSAGAIRAAFPSLRSVRTTFAWTWLERAITPEELHAIGGGLGSETDSGVRADIPCRRADSTYEPCAMQQTQFTTGLFSNRGGLNLD